MQETIGEIADFEQAGRVFIDKSDVYIVGSPAFEQIRDTKVAEYRIKHSTMGIKEIHALTKEREGLEVLKEEDLNDEEKKVFDEIANEEIDVMVVHKPSLEFAGKKIKVKHIPAFAEAVIKSYMERFPDQLVDTEKDFMVIRVNFEKRNIAIQSIK